MAPRGVAVVSVDNAIGTWQYSMDNGVSWIPFGPVSETSALLFDPSATVRLRAECQCEPTGDDDNPRLGSNE